MHRTSTSKKSITLGYILYIYYLVSVQESNNNIKVLINFDDKVNIITLIYTLEFGF